MTRFLGAIMVRAAAALLAASLLPAAAQQPGGGNVFQPQPGQPGKDVIWMPTPDAVVEKMLDMAQVTKKDSVVDLGSGDGKITIAAAKRGARARGIEYNPDMVELSRRNAKQAGVKATFEHGDIFKSDFRKADVVTLYLLPHLNIKLRPTLLAMKPGTRVTSHSFDMGDWEADQVAEVDTRKAYLWHVPANVEGTWRVSIAGQPGPTLELRQKYQKLEGEVTSNGAKLTDVGIDGAAIRFVVDDGSGRVQRFQGTADHNGRMRGTVSDGQGSRAFTAVRR